MIIKIAKTFKRWQFVYCVYSSLLLCVNISNRAQNEVRESRAWQHLILFRSVLFEFDNTFSQFWRKEKSFYMLSRTLHIYSTCSYSVPVCLFVHCWCTTSSSYVSVLFFVRLFFPFVSFCTFRSNKNVNHQTGEEEEKLAERKLCSVCCETDSVCTIN